LGPRHLYIYLYLSLLLSFYGTGTVRGPTDVGTVVRLRGTCRHLSRLADDEWAIWRPLVHRHYPVAAARFRPPPDVGDLVHPGEHLDDSADSWQDLFKVETHWKNRALEQDFLWLTVGHYEGMSWKEIFSLEPESFELIRSFQVDAGMEEFSRLIRECGL
jgi:hypothetical protein